MQNQARSFSAAIGAIREGDAEGVHRARIATRRMLQALPLTFEWHPEP